MVSLDSFAQTNPALGAATLYWLCDGYSAIEKRTPVGLILPWAVLSLVLLAPDEVRGSLPKTGAAKLGVLMHENPTWRVLAPQAMRGAAPAFWVSLRMGVGLGVLRLQDAKLHTGRAVATPRTDFEKDIRRRSRALGQVIAKERDDVSRALLFGLGIGP